ncbi:MAG: tetratricopeptide (TPR) repeat protein [Paraglaciecola sp.]|jgi:tetratricopeptide (TPR) repeat protein
MNYSTQTLLILSLCLFISACSMAPKQANELNIPAQNEPQDHPLISGTQAQSEGAVLLSKMNHFLTSEPSMASAMAKQFKQSIHSYQQQDYAQALAHLSSYLHDNSGYSSVWLLRGDIATNQKQPTQAKAFYQKALEVNGNNYLAHNRLAIGSRNEGQFEQALASYNKALESWQGFALGYLNRGILLDVYMGKKQDALQDYQHYQDLVSVTQGKPDKKVRGWIIDLTRQLKQ